jgi:Xaa-Pro aminopeptidase
MIDYSQRRGRVRKSFGKLGIDALLVTNFTNVTYLTGFMGDDSYLLLTARDEVLVTDPRYTTQLEDECPGLELEVRSPGQSMLEAVSRLAERLRVSRLGIEGDSMQVSLHEQLGKKLPKLSLVTTTGLVEELREIKDRFEIEELRQAVRYAERAFAMVRHSMQPERTERQVANQLEFQMREFGAKGRSFESIVAVGERAALPHGRPTDKRIGEADFTLVDWGAQGRLYKSDLTRLVVTAKISPKLKRVYGVVLQAQLQAIAAIKPGVPAKDIDAVARGVIADAGFDRFFGHSLGHGIGLDIHEGPRLAKTNDRPLRPGMVVTVEPGIYLPGWGGVRIEDDVLVTKTGHEVLTSAPKQLEDSVLSL